MKKKLKFKFFLLFAVVVVAISAIPIIQSLGVGKSDDGLNVKISMAGFNPNTIEGKAGEPLKITMINLDNKNHTDGSGWHQFKNESLKIDYTIPPKSNFPITLDIDKPGIYPFYCGVCCGGKNNPNMWITVKIT